MKLIISILILALSFYICYNFDDTFYAYSNTITIRLQYLFAYGNCTGIVECILYACSVCGDRTFSQFILLLLWVKVGNKQQILKLIIMYSLASFTGDFAKMILREPRPFYITDQILLDFCFTGFGGPSGHALRSLVFYVLVADTILYKKHKCDDFDNQFIHHSFEELYPRSKITLLQCKSLLGLFLGLAGLARMYFGVHFLNQVLFGWILGFYLLFLYYCCDLENFLDYKLNKMINSTHIRIFKSSLLQRGILLGLIININFFLYFELQNSEQLQNNKQQWKEFVNLQVLCNGNDQFYNNSFENHDIIGTSIIAMPFFLYYCLKFSNLSKESMRGTQKINQTLEFLRIAIILILVIIVYQGRKICLKIFFQEQIIFSYICFGLGYYLIISIILINIIPNINRLLKIKNSGIQRNKFLDNIQQSQIQEIEL